MYEFQQEPVATLLRIIFIVWLCVALWILLLTPLFSYLKKGRAIFPKWWKFLLVSYVTGNLVIFTVIYNVMRNPEDLIIGLSYGGLFMGMMTLIIGLVAASIFLLPRIISDGIKSIKYDGKGTLRRFLYIVAVITFFALVNWLISTF